MSRWRRILLSPPLIALVWVLVLYSGAGFFLFPYLARHYGPKIIHERTGLRAVVGQLRFNPYTLELEVKGVGVGCIRSLWPKSMRLIIQNIYL